MSDRTKGVGITLYRAEGTMGPAMRSLSTDRQRAFVYAMLDNGSTNYTKCAMIAGYNAENLNSLQVTAHRLAHDERIQAAIQEEARRRIKAGAIMAASHLLTIAENPAHKDQLKAIAMMLDRSGLHAMSEHKVTVEHTDLDERAALAKINERMTQLGFDAEARTKMLGAYGIVDADFEVVDQQMPEVGQLEKEEWEE